ncbi:hypothetical protein BT96DRAFT_408538 [Gymnopus androsaceus JB14]|uniref:Uncharacterized protein n=1 Tax=Gymnopus androsaceus JB14 TaxID=1447944 RepID=A0A6A4GUR4_9AGAR|nr:hypothetical protein BT96DRAFT_408538 [Gymnopus androsaceus JB14]
MQLHWCTETGAVYWIVKFIMFPCLILLLRNYLHTFTIIIPICCIAFFGIYHLIYDHDLYPFHFISKTWVSAIARSPSVQLCTALYRTVQSCTEEDLAMGSSRFC